MINQDCENQNKADLSGYKCLSFDDHGLRDFGWQLDSGCLDLLLFKGIGIPSLSF